MDNPFVQLELLAMLGVPLATLWSVTYLTHLVKDSVQPPILLVLLTIEAIVVFLCSTYFGFLIINTRVFGNINPPELLPVTLAAFITPMLMINIIAVMLWRQNGGTAKKEGYESETTKEKAGNG